MLFRKVDCVDPDVKIKPNKRKLIYLACPYSDASVAVRLHRFKEATKAAAALIRQGHFVFSPITMTHPIDQEIAGADDTLGSEFWVAFDEAFMERCDLFVLLPLEGWQKSNGVRREIEFFQAARKSLMVLSDDYSLRPLSSLGEAEARSRQVLG
jgi:hypothetical protein